MIFYIYSFDVLILIVHNIQWILHNFSGAPHLSKTLGSKVNALLRAGTNKRGGMSDKWTDTDKRGRENDKSTFVSSLKICLTKCGTSEPTYCLSSVFWHHGWRCLTWLGFSLISDQLNMSSLISTSMRWNFSANCLNKVTTTKSLTLD